MRKKNRAAFFLFIMPSLVGVVIFVILPFLDVFKRSFTTAVTGKFTGVENYKMIFHNQAFLTAAKNTLGFTLVCIPLLVLIGFLIALPLSSLKSTGQRASQSSSLIKSIYLFPLAVPTATIVMVWKMVFYQQGFLNLFLSETGKWTGLWGEVHKDYLETQAAFWVLVCSYIWKNTGYTVVLWLVGILGIPEEILDAAKVDGAGRSAQVRHIILPNLKGTLYTIVILSFLNSFKIYREAYLVAGAYPHKSIYLLQHIFNNWFVNLEFDKMAAATVCTGVFLFIVILLLQKSWDKDEA